MSIWRKDGLFHMGILDELFPADMGESLQIVMLPNKCQWFHSELQNQLNNLHLLEGSTLYVLDLFLVL